MRNKKIREVDNSLEELIDKGFFGAKSKKLSDLKKQASLVTCFYQYALSIVEKKYVNNQLIYDISNKLCIIYIQAMKNNRQAVYDIIESFIMGTKQHPELENLSSYRNFIFSKENLSNEISQAQKIAPLSYSQKMKFGNDIAADYSSTIEMVSKIAVSFLQLDGLIAKKNLKIEKLVKLSTANKLNQLNQSTVIDWSFITNCVKKDIRNAESHLNFSYDPDILCFVGKFFNNKINSYRTIRVPFKEFLLETCADASAVVLGFFLSCFILCLAAIDIMKFRKIVAIMDRNA